MKILCTAAAKFEIEPLVERFKRLDFFDEKEGCFIVNDFEIHFLITEIGPVLTTYNLTKTLANKDFDFILNIGIGGSFKKSIEPGTVVCVEEEVFADMGTEDEGTIKTLFESGLLDENEFPFRNGRLINHGHNYTSQIMNELRKVKGITVNRASGSRKTADVLYEKYKAEIETMEGAAVFYTCLKERVPFSEIRAVSNFVGDRNKSNWEIDKAVKNLTDVVFEILMYLKNDKDK